jgi:hypothetical protein
MKLYYISFFYFNIILLLFFILRIDIIFLIFFFIRKTYSIFKESLTEYIFQEFDGLTKEGQFLDLYENKLYVDFGLDAGLEEFYIQNIYMTYALFNINLDLESYSGSFTFKWNDFNIEELNFRKSKEINFKKLYLDSDSELNLYIYKVLNKLSIIEGIKDEDYINLYNYKNINRGEIEEPLFLEENEKYYYIFLKKYFLRENFYDILVKDNYIRFFFYNNFIENLKKRTFLNKYNNKNKKKEIYLIDSLKIDILDIKKNILNNSFFKK